MRVILALAAIVATTAAADSQERLAEVRARIAEVQVAIEADRVRRGRLTGELAEAERDIGRIAGELHALEGRIDASRQKIAALESERERQREALDRRLDSLAEQIRAAYRVGRQGRLQLILSQDDPAALGRLLAYYEYYADAQNTAIAGLREELAALTQTRDALAHERERLDAERARRARHLAALEHSRAKRKAALETVRTRLSERERTLAELRADEAELRRLIESLRDRLGELPAEGPVEDFARLKGRLPPPVTGRTIATFGSPKADGRLRWQGVWLAAPEGAPVKAAAAGRVVYVGWMHRYGLIAVLDHGGDHYTVYGHNQGVYVEPGQWVAAGETVAAAGTSGGHDTSGVYFEIRRGRTPVNPESWLVGDRGWNR